MERAIVPYRGKRYKLTVPRPMSYSVNPYVQAARWGMDNPNTVRAGVEALKFASRSTYRAGKYVVGKRKRGMTSRRAKIEAKVGDKNRTPPNRVETNETKDAVTRTLYATDLTDIERHTTAANLGLPGSRNTNVISFSGFKYCISVKNTSTAELYFNLAIIVPKNPTEFRTLQGAISGFFRSESGTTRETDFSENLSGLEFRCLPINAGKFTVLSHKRYLIRQNVFANSIVLEKYVNLYGRKFTYNSNDSYSMQDPVYFVYWMDNMGATIGQASTTGAKVQVRLIKYFRDKFGG